MGMYLMEKNQPKNTYVFFCDDLMAMNLMVERILIIITSPSTTIQNVVNSRIPNFHYISGLCCAGFFPWHLLSSLQGTCHPCSAKDLAAAKPKPLEAPVMTTVFLGFRKGMALGGFKKGQLRMNWPRFERNG